MAAAAICRRNYRPVLVSTLLKCHNNINKSLDLLNRRASSLGGEELKYDVVVVGGGIIGVATARELKMRHPNLKMAILEKEKKLAFHQSGHNSGVIHAGIYYTPGSLKAKLCVEGMDLAYKFLDEKKIPYKKCGKLIVATTDAENARLDDLIDKGKKNNVRDMQVVDCLGIKKIEPHCEGLRAIWSPHTGIVDWALVTEQLGKDFTELGGKIHLGFEVENFESTETVGGKEAPYPLQITGDEKVVMTSHAVVCAGLYSDKLAQLSGCSADPQILPVRGEYLLLNPKKTSLVKGNIYPVPDPRFPFLGVHFTPRMDGSVWLGPNAVFAFKREGYSWKDYDMGELMGTLKNPGFYKLAIKNFVYGSQEMAKSFFKSLQVQELRKFIPDITVADVSRGPAGVRAQAMGRDGNLVDDFVFDVCGKGDDAMHRVLHCRNCPSPGATSSLAIARMIADRVKEEYKL